MSSGSFNFEPIEVPKIKTKYRKIKTKIPVPESLEILDNIHNIETRSMHGSYPMVWDKAYDFQIEDKWGNKWIDFTSTIFVANAGHSNKKIVESIKKVLDKPLLHTYNYLSEERNSYLSYLLSNVPNYFEKAFLLSAGTEATEVALKLMRLSSLKKQKEKPGIICFEGNWHGRTLGAQMMSHNVDQKKWIGYHDPNIHHIDFPYPWVKGSSEKGFFKGKFDEYCQINKLDPKKDFAGFMLETFQGWGSIFYPKNFIDEIKDCCVENDILLVFDEMQAGFGRTGKLFGYMHYNVEPDIICCGKGSSSSLPLSIVLGNSKIMDLPDIGSMSSTHSANPLVCAAGEANLRSIIEDDLINNSYNLGKLFHKKLIEIKDNNHTLISNIFGKGLIAGVLFNDFKGVKGAEICDKVAEMCFQSGLLVVHTGRESIKLGPPLNISKEALIEGLEVFSFCISSCIKNI